MDIRAIQQQAWENKLAKGFNINDVALEFGLLTAEVVPMKLDMTVCCAASKAPANPLLASGAYQPN